MHDVGMIYIFLGHVESKGPDRSLLSTAVWVGLAAGMCVWHRQDWLLSFPPYIHTRAFTTGNCHCWPQLEPKVGPASASAELACPLFALRGISTKHNAVHAH